MVKVFAPLMSLDATGTLGDAITFTKWKGRNVVRQRVIPSNPKSEAQTGRRSMFGFITQNWAALAVVDKGSWQGLADQAVISPFNAYVGENMKNWHNYLAPSQFYPTLRSDLASDRVLSAAAWEENRIKISSTATTANQQWGLCIFASTTTPVVESVGLHILAVLDDDIAAHDYYWTPPSIGTWYFESQAFSVEGLLAAAGGEQSAIP